MWLLLTIACAEPPQYSVPTRPTNGAQSGQPNSPPNPPLANANGSPKAPPVQRSTPATKSSVAGPPPNISDLLPTATTTAEAGAQEAEIKNVPDPDELMPISEILSGECKPIASTAHLELENGGINVSGTVNVAVPMSGPLLIELVQVKDQQSYSLYSVTCVSGKVEENYEADLEFTAKFPANLSSVYVLAVIDNDGNGPSLSDPAARSELIALQDGQGISLNIKKDTTIAPIQLPLLTNNEPLPEVNAPK